MPILTQAGTPKVLNKITCKLLSNLQSLTSPSFLIIELSQMGGWGGKVILRRRNQAATRKNKKHNPYDNTPGHITFQITIVDMFLEVFQLVSKPDVYLQAII